MKKTFLLVVCSIFATTLFAQKPLEGFTTSETGVKYKFVQRNEKGQPVLKDDVVIGKFSIMFGDTLVADAKKMQSQPIVKVDAASKVFNGDLIDGILLMKKGEICTFAFERDSLIKLFGQVPEYFKSGMYAYWTIQVEDIKTPEQQAKEEAAMKAQQEEKMKQQKIISDSLGALEPAILQKAIKEYSFDNKLVNGVYFKKTLSNKDKQTPKEGDNVKVHYVGKFVDGKLFDTSVETAAKAAGKYQEGRKYEPLEFTIGKHMMIPGFEEAVKMMNKGEKAIVLIPSTLAYGAQGRGEISPSTPLIFELEIVDIIKGTAPAQGQPQIKMVPSQTKPADKKATPKKK